MVKLQGQRHRRNVKRLWHGLFHIYHGVKLVVSALDAVADEAEIERIIVRHLEMISIETECQAWWKATAIFADDDKHCLDFHEYAYFHHCLVMAMNNDDTTNYITKKEALSSLDEDWVRDSEGSGRVDKTEFFHSVVDLAVAWCDVPEDPSCVLAFLGSLFPRVFTHNPQSIKERMRMARQDKSGQNHSIETTDFLDFLWDDRGHGNKRDPESSQSECTATGCSSSCGGSSSGSGSGSATPTTPSSQVQAGARTVSPDNELRTVLSPRQYLDGIGSRSPLPSFVAPPPSLAFASASRGDGLLCPSPTSLLPATASREMALPALRSHTVVSEQAPPQDARALFAGTGRGTGRSAAAAGGTAASGHVSPGLPPLKAVGGGAGLAGAERGGGRGRGWKAVRFDDEDDIGAGGVGAPCRSGRAGRSSTGAAAGPAGWPGNDSGDTCGPTLPDYPHSHPLSVDPRFARPASSVVSSSSSAAGGRAGVDPRQQVRPHSTASAGYFRGGGGGVGGGHRGDSGRRCRPLSGSRSDGRFGSSSISMGSNSRWHGSSQDGGVVGSSSSSSSRMDMYRSRGGQAYYPQVGQLRTGAGVGGLVFSGGASNSSGVDAGGLMTSASPSYLSPVQAPRRLQPPQPQLALWSPKVCTCTHRIFCSCGKLQVGGGAVGGSRGSWSVWYDSILAELQQRQKL